MADTYHSARPRPIRRGSRVIVRALAGSTMLAALFTAQHASAQQQVVGACAGVSLPRSVVTDIVAPVVTGIATPLEGAVNGLLSILLPRLNLNVTGLLNTAASGQPITLQAIGPDGTVLGPGTDCRVTSDAISLDTPAGIAIGGNRITGLGAEGVTSFSSDVNAIALGNNARAELGALSSIAFGTNSRVTAANSVALGAGSFAGRGALAGYVVPGLAGTQTSAGEVSVGAPGALRQITNVAAGSAPTDVATVGQVAALTANTLQYDSVDRTRATLAGGAPGTVLANVAPGALTATSTEAVNGSQLFATNAAVGANTGAIATNTGAIAALDTRVGANTAGVAALNTQVATNTSGLAALDTRVATNTTGLAALDAVAVRYDAADRGLITLGGGAAGTGLANLRAGALTATSTEAVNGSQLFATNAAVGNNTGAITGNTGAIAALDTRVGANTAGLTALDGRVATNTAGLGTLGAQVATNTAGVAALDTRVATNTTGLAALDAVAVRYDAADRGLITLGGGAAGTGLANLRAGALTATSTEAVNGSQLFATNAAVGANTGAITGNTGAIAALDTRVGANTAGLTALDGRVATNTAGLGTLGTQVATNTAGVSALDTRVATNTTGLAALDAVAVRYDAADRGLITLGGGAAGTGLANLRAGALTATSTEAVNGSQLFAANAAVGANTGAIAGNTGAIAALDTRVGTNAAGLAALDAVAVRYDTAGRDIITFGGAAGTRLSNITPGALSATSGDAVNGSQLFATNTQVAANTSAIAGLGNGAVGPVRYSSLAAPTTPNGGTVTDDLTLSGTGTGPVRLHNVGAGSIAAGSTDAVNGGQLFAFSDQLGLANSVLYDTDATGARLNRITLTGGVAGAPVTLANVAAGALTATSTEAVNGSQLFVANAAIGANTGAIASATGAIAALDTRVGANTSGLAALDGRVATNTSGLAALDTRVATNTSGLAALDAVAVRYDGADRAVITFGGATGTRLTNITPGTLSATSSDAVNGAQLFATNAQVAANSSAIAGLGNGATGPVRYSSLAAPTTPNGGTVTDDLTLSGTGTGPVRLHNVGDGAIATGSNDAINGGQLFAFSNQLGLANSVLYDTNAAGARTNRITFSGGVAAAPVTLANVAAGTLAAGSDEAVNGAQLFATNTAVGANAGAITALDGRVTNNTTEIANLATGVATNTTAITNLGTRVTNTETSIANLTSGATNLDARVTNNETQIANVSAGVTNNTNAINTLADAVGNQPIRYANAATPTTPNGGTVSDDATLAGASGGPVGLHNVRGGALAAGSNDAVNGDQLFATNTQVADNSAAITNLTNTIAGSTIVPIQYSDAATPTTPNGGQLTNDLTLVGANLTAPVGLHNVRAGAVSATSTDAVNGQQLFAVATTAENGLQYDRDAAGTRTNTVTLAGGNAAAPVTVANVAAGTVAAGSTQAVNGGQLYAVATTAANGLQYDRDASGARTNTVTLTGGNAAAPVTVANVAAGTVAVGSTEAVNGEQLYATAQVAQQAAALGSNSVQYDQSRTSVTFSNTSNAPVSLRNIAAGVSTTDAVNVGQLQSGLQGAVTQANAYTDARMDALRFDLRDVRRDLGAGTSAGLAAAALPQANEPGRTMIAVGGGTYRGQSAIAFGASTYLNDGHSILRLGATYDSRGYGGANAGYGYQF